MEGKSFRGDVRNKGAFWLQGLDRILAEVRYQQSSAI